MPDQVVLETEARISPLINEKKRLFNDLLTAKGTILLFCHSLFLMHKHPHAHNITHCEIYFFGLKAILVVVIWSNRISNFRKHQGFLSC